MRLREIARMQRARRHKGETLNLSVIVHRPEHYEVISILDHGRARAVLLPPGIGGKARSASVTVLPRLGALNFGATRALRRSRAHSHSMPTARA